MRARAGALLGLCAAACTAVEWDASQPLRCGAGNACPEDRVCVQGLCQPNRPPTAADDTATTPESTPVVIRVLDNDRDPDGRALTLVSVGTPAHGGAVANGDGTVTYTPQTSFNGSDVFPYTAASAYGFTVTASVSVTVTPVNDPPIAADDRVTTAENTPVTIPVLANDSDPDGDPLVIASVGEAQFGTTALGGGGLVTYTPAPLFSGEDSFSYSVADPAGLTATATVFVTVTFVNQPPVAFDDSVVTAEDTPVVVAVLANDSDPEGNPLLVTATSAPAHGTVAVNGDGTITYSPAANYSGSDQFDYSIDDGTGLTATATVTVAVVPVNDLPQANPDQYATTEETPLSVQAPGVLANDGDMDGDRLSAVLVSGPAHGTLTLASNGSFLYLPATNFSGSDSFTYRARDSFAVSTPATVTIAVGAVNDPPTARADAYATDEDTLLTVAAPGVLANDGDVEGDPLTATLANAPAHGTVTLNADGSFSYLPDASFNGVDSFTYRANDGALDSSATTVRITVNAVNDTPVAADDAYTTPVDAPLAVAAPGVLANDVDPDGNPITAALVAGPLHGLLTLNPDGSFVYTPDASFAGADSFTYQASDGLLDSNVATVTIQVDEPPIAFGDAYETDEDQPLVVAAPGVLGNDVDPEGGTLTAVLVTGPAHGTLTLNADGSFSYTPTQDYFGADSFTYAASDGVSSSNVATVALDVHPVNDAPVAVADAYSTDEDVPLVVDAPGVLANDTDTEGDALSAELATPAAHGTVVLSPDGSFTYTPDSDFHGTDSFSYRASDGLLDSAPAVVTITVNPVNDPPVVNADTYVVNRNAVLNVAAPGVLGNDSDPEGSALTAVLEGTAAHGTVSLNANGSFSYTPAAGYAGADSFTYRASDGAVLSEIATVSITVNAPPVANADAYTVSATSSLSVAAPGVLGNDTDPEGAALMAALVTGPSHGSLTLQANGSFTYTPIASYAGADTFTYRASDGLASSTAATVTLTVDGRPIAVDDVATVAVPGGTASIDVVANDSDPEGEPLHLVSASTDGTQGTVTVDGGTVIYHALPAFSGRDTVSYTVADTASPPNTASATLVVVRRPAFGTRTRHTVGTAPAALALLDIDTDGLTDVAVANSGSGNVTVFFQGAGGALTSAGPYSAGTTPSAVAIGQLVGNAQSALDVVVADEGGNQVIVRDGSNLGGNPTTRAAGTSPAAVLVADVDASGKSDIVVVDAIADANNVRVLYGPNYNSSLLLTAGSSPSAVAVADLDGNGLPDIVVANQGSNDVTVFLQGPAGSFTATGYPVGSSPSSVAVGDLNADGHPDIAVANAASGTVSVLLQQSGGAFAAAVDFAAGSTPSSVAIGQLNGDASPDIVVANRIQSGTVSILANGTLAAATRPAFSTPVVYSTGGRMPSAVAIGNLTGDGKPDIAVVNRDDDELVVLPNQN